MQITFTFSEANALATLLDREFRVDGAQAVINYGTILVKMKQAAEAEQTAETEEPTDGN